MWGKVKHLFLDLVNETKRIYISGRRGVISLIPKNGRDTNISQELVPDYLIVHRPQIDFENYTQQN